jgi:hypothetical protein
LLIIELDRHRDFAVPNRQCQLRHLLSLEPNHK